MDSFDRVGGRARVFVGGQEIEVEDVFVDIHDVEREPRMSLNRITGYIERVRAPGVRFTYVVSADYDPDYWRGLQDVDITVIYPFKSGTRKRLEYAQCFQD